MKAPDNLTARGKEHWDKLAPEVAQGGWSQARQHQLYLICDQVGYYEAAKTEIVELGVTVESRGGVTANPAFVVLDKALAKMFSGYRALGVKGPVLDDSRAAAQKIEQVMRGEK